MLHKLATLFPTGAREALRLLAMRRPARQAESGQSRLLMMFHAC